MLKVIPNKPIEPHYVLIYNSMVGDGDGDIEEEISLKGYNEDYIEKLYIILDKIYSYSGRGFEDTMDFRLMKRMKKDNQFTDEEFDFFVEEVLNFKKDYTFYEIDMAWRDCDFIVRDNYEANSMVMGVGLLYRDETDNLLNVVIYNDKE